MLARLGGKEYPGYECQVKPEDAQRQEKTRNLEGPF